MKPRKNVFPKRPALPKKGLSAAAHSKAMKKSWLLIHSLIDGNSRKDPFDAVTKGLLVHLPR